MVAVAAVVRADLVVLAMMRISREATVEFQSARVGSVPPLGAIGIVSTNPGRGSHLTQACCLVLARVTRLSVAPQAVFVLPGRRSFLGDWNAQLNPRNVRPVARYFPLTT